MTNNNLPRDFSRVKPDIAYYGIKLWDHPSKINERGEWVFVDMPVRYVLGWLDLLNERDKQKTTPDRQTLMKALDSVMKDFPPAQESRDAPLNMLFDAATYIVSLQDTIERYKEAHEYMEGRCRNLTARYNKIKEELEELRGKGGAEV